MIIISAAARPAATDTNEAATSGHEGKGVCVMPDVDTKIARGSR
jgi:hypothetical protein